jgi:ketosteroid isomerase-like protein
MSQESTTHDPVELTRRIFEAVNRGDFDAMMSHFAPGAVWETTVLGTFEGLAAIRGFQEDWSATYEELEFEPEEIVDLGNGVAFAIAHQSGRLVGVSGHVQMRYVLVAIWVDGMIERMWYYDDIEEGRAAAERLAKERG